MSTSTHLQYVPFCSSITTTFWDAFSKLKLNELQLNTDPLSLHGVYSRRIIEGLPPFLELHNNAFQRDAKGQSGEITISGTLINTNTIEEYKENDKLKLLRNIAAPIWEALVSGEAENNPSILSSFLIYIFADLKKYHYFYWLACPVFAYPTNIDLLKLTPLHNQIKESKLVDTLLTAVQDSEVGLDYFTVKISESRAEILPLVSYYKLKSNEINESAQIMLGFSDPCNSADYPGWPLRNLLTLAAIRWPEFRKHTVLSLREKITRGVTSISQSLVLEVEIPKDEGCPKEMPQCLGWEKNERSKMGPRFVNLRSSMEPEKLSESAVELNLKLMRWRFVPNLDLEVIRNCRCLLLGAGTLGCNVARCLLGWGVQKISFIDCGTVSFSNPVRQSLYTFENCLHDGQKKVDAATKALKSIYPKVNAEGFDITVPMPGHPVGPSQVDEVTKDIMKLEELVRSHEAIFLLSDSRESRWLLSLLGAAEQKIVITAALGFDSFMVIRHGVPFSSEIGLAASNNDTNRLGCYFCNDVVAPGNSTSDRTLDQQCTVTRPGMSFMAAGHAVEILISLLQHPLRGNAPAYSENEDSRSDEGVLGMVPHSIRYYLSRLNQLTTSTTSFKNCSACGPNVLKMYKEKGAEFLIQVFNSTQYLEDISGLATLHQETEQIKLWELSESEDESCT